MGLWKGLLGNGNGDGNSEGIGYSGVKASQRFLDMATNVEGIAKGDWDRGWDGANGDCWSWTYLGSFSSYSLSRIFVGAFRWVVL